MWEAARSKLFFVAVAAVVLSGMAAVARVAGAEDRPWPFEGPVGRAECGPGSRPESGLSGSIPVEERASGRSSQGYTCNLEEVGHYGAAEGFEGAEWQMAWYGDCAYYDTKLSGTQTKRGTIVLDVADPTAPELITTFKASNVIHGLGVSEDGNRLYLAHINDDFGSTLLLNRRSLVDTNGLGIYDVSEINARETMPEVALLSTLTWRDGAIGQHAVPFTKAGRSYVVFVDELFHGGARIIDITDERNPVGVAKLKTRKPDSKFEQGARRSRTSKTRRAGGPHHRGPQEIGYFNPGGDGTRAPGSFGGTTGGYASAQPRIIPERSEIWFTDQDRGFYAVRFTNGA